MPNEKNKQFYADTVETFLIQLLGYRSLLNSQTGGFLSNYLPDTANDEAFRSLQTNSFSKCLQDTKSSSDESANSFNTQFQSIASQAKEFDQSISDKLKQNLTQEALPRQYLGYSIMLFLGESLTKEHLG